MAALFGNGNDGRREPKSLVEFRAGKMSLSGTTVTADTRKGLIYMKQEDRLMHFYWKDRKNGEIADDFILFPGEVEFKRVNQCTTGRVFMLKFHDRPDRKYFYWMQEPKDTRDEELRKKVNDLINNPPDPSQSEGLGGLQALMGGHGASLQNLLAGGNPQLLEQLMTSGALSPLQSGGLFDGAGQGQGSASSTTRASSGRRENGSTGSTGASQSTPARSQQPARANQLQLGDLQNILSSMNIPSGSSQETKPEEDRVGLTDVVTPDVLRPLSNDASVRTQVEAHLPPTSEGAEVVLTSPQFQQALGTFNSALQSGQLGPLMSQFGLGDQVAAAATTGDVNGFAEALQDAMGGAPAAGGTEEKGEKEKEEKEKDGDSEGKEDKDKTSDKNN